MCLPREVSEDCFIAGEREPSEEQDAFGETDSAYESTLADNDSSRPEAEIDDPGDNYNRPVSRFAMAVATAPLSIESTIGESPPDGASRTANPEDAAIAELLEREETSMQANTDFDFGYSREANGAVLADAETHEYGVELEHVNGSGFDDFDSGEYQEVESVSDISQQYDQQEEEGGFSGLAVRLLGKNREQWAKPSIEMLESVQDRGVPEDQIRETAETIRQTFADYDIEVEIGNIKYGPTVTMYGIIPGWVRRYKQVKLEDEFGNPIRTRMASR
ncbi:hypothetical protein GBAR_LOCUS15933 [Geodia barretti]|uniref:FtsK alpha domain-containing protein n=1 Tax=Geodia barretti TaxID=519541 RepID=A0AA35SDA0_GEOBA|nr:hypothetical protein GBAR_LOCUS15933 [Geodia barretti]